MASVQQSKYTTPFARPSSGYVTITHPQHPLYGQRLRYARVQQRQGVELDLVVCLPNGVHAGITASCTDYQPSQKLASGEDLALIEIQGLRAMVSYMTTLACADV